MVGGCHAISEQDLVLQHGRWEEIVVRGPLCNVVERGSYVTGSILSALTLRRSTLGTGTLCSAYKGDDPAILILAKYTEYFKKRKYDASTKKEEDTIKMHLFVPNSDVSVVNDSFTMNESLQGLGSNE